MAGRGRAGADERLALELAGGKTVRDAAAAVGIAERTAFRRLSDPAFQAMVDGLRSAMIGRASGRLASSMSAAAEVLHELLGSADENVRLKSAVKVIELGMKVEELAGLQKRVEELEERQRGGRL